MTAPRAMGDSRRAIKTVVDRLAGRPRGSPTETYTEAEALAWAAASPAPVSGSPRRRGGPAMWARRLWRLCRNAVIDLRYGGFLGGTVVTRYAHLGAHPTGNSDYVVMKAIFRGRVRRGDVLVDVGCGRGRVINHWLGLRLENRVVGIEIDPDIAARTRKRLQGRFPNVSIITGDAADRLPHDASLLYLFNPFNASTMERFKRSVVERCPSATLLYYYPVYVQTFRDDPAWVVEEVALDPLLPVGYRTYPLAVIRRAP